VDTIYVCHELQGMTPDEILEAYPHLTLSQIHAALAYYFDHPEEIRAGLKRDQDFADELEAEQGATKLSTLRDALFGRYKAGELLQALLLVHSCLTAEEMVNRVEWL
jgi:hypothetical protein